MNLTYKKFIKKYKKALNKRTKNYLMSPIRDCFGASGGLKITILTASL